MIEAQSKPFLALLCALLLGANTWADTSSRTRRLPSVENLVDLPSSGSNEKPADATGPITDHTSASDKSSKSAQTEAGPKLDSAEQASDEKSKSDDKSKPTETPRQDMSGEKWTVKLGGHVQMDSVHWITASDAVVGDQNYFEFRRLRLVADGVGYGVCDFRLQLTLEPETVGESAPGTVTSPEVKDAYFSLNEIPRLGRFRIGNFFVPFSLEQVTNDTNNTFLERSIPIPGAFSPDREVGIAFYNCTEDQRLTWCQGIFLDSISESLKERIDDNQGYRVSSRVTWLPYYDEPSNGRYLFHTGLGLLHTKDQDGRVRFRARPQVREGPRLIDSGIILADAYTTGNIELASVRGPVTIQGEAFLTAIDGDFAGTTYVDGAYIYCSYFLTGENRIYDRFGQHGAQFSRNIPYSNFFMVPGGCGPGAWEAKARYSTLDLHNLDRGRYQDLTLGVNWYWSDRTRVMMDWIHPFTTRDTSFGSTQADLLAMRFDFNW